MPPWDVYAERLVSLGYGFPVYRPEFPVSDYGDAARIGDVGYIRQGRFVPFFNVVGGRNSGEHAQVPNFESLVYPPRLYDSQPYYQAPGMLTCTNVREFNASIHGGAGESVTMIQIVLSPPESLIGFTAHPLGLQWRELLKSGP